NAFSLDLFSNTCLSNKKPVLSKIQPGANFFSFAKKSYKKGLVQIKVIPKMETLIASNVSTLGPFALATPAFVF
ncbi:MAG: hypothetical protein KDC49_23205, partial [Saprospiraceae bacterium]|nr:hypothetical protein [Saprospiraceae bacterium]